MAEGDKHVGAYVEKTGDLFSSPASDSLAHCVSEDMAMGKGIAVEFKKRFKRVNTLKDQKVKTGGVAVLKDGDRFIYYLVTKERYFHKPTYKTLSSSLEAMKAHASANGVKAISMPKIGSGLDRLDWASVSQNLKTCLNTSGISITVYKL